MSMEDFIIIVYCLIDELLKKQIGNDKLRKRGFNPALSDSEVITMEIIAEFLGIDTDYRITSKLCKTCRQLIVNKATNEKIISH